MHLIHLFYQQVFLWWPCSVNLASNWLVGLKIHMESILWIAFIIQSCMNANEFRDPSDDRVMVVMTSDGNRSGYTIRTNYGLIKLAKQSSLDGICRLFELSVTVKLFVGFNKRQIFIFYFPLYCFSVFFLCVR